MSANRGKFVSNIAALRPTDAPATPGRSADGFEGVLRRGLCLRPGGCSLRGGGPFCVAMREAGWDGGGRECLQAEESLSAVSRLCDRRMLPQRPAGLSMVLRAFLCRGPCLRSGGCSLRGGGLFVGKAGGTVEAGMSANRGKFVSNIAALRPTDAPATPGRSVDGFFGAGFVSWALSALRGLFPSRGRAFLRARRAERRKRECLQAEESLSAVSRLCDRRMLPQRPAGLPPVFSRPFLRRGLCPRPGACPHRGAGLFAWRCAKCGGALAKRAERLGTGLFAWRRAATVTTFG